MRLKNAFSGLNRLENKFGRPPKQIRQLVTFSEENLNRYCRGGYHPVRIGDVFNDERYQAVSKLGYGIYSTVWLAFDRRTQRHVALKILTADSFGQGTDTFEIDILKQIKHQHTSDIGTHHILGLLDEFEHQGPHGSHVCLVFRAVGPDMSRYRRLFPKPKLPPSLMKTLSRHILLALSFLHDACRVIHTDIKPQNILIETSALKIMFEQVASKVFQSSSLSREPPNDFYTRSIQVSSAKEDITEPNDPCFRLADFGTASWFDKHLTEWIQPEKLRAPEVILGAEWTHKVDIWNLGLIIWELAEGKLVFDGQWGPNDSYTPEAHLAQMNAVLGPMPKQLLERSSHQSQYFDENGDLLRPSTFPPSPLERISQNSDFTVSERTKFLNFISSMVRLNPEERLDAKKLLESPWLAQ